MMNYYHDYKMNCPSSWTFFRKHLERINFNVLFRIISISNGIARVSSCLGFGISCLQIMDYFNL